MAVLFLDASALVKRYVAETGSVWVIGETSPASQNECWIATITAVEVLSALYLRQRAGSLTLGQAQLAEHAFRHELRTHFRRVHVATKVINDAMSLVARRQLRAYDAVQLATALVVRDRYQALSQPVTLLCADQILNAAAKAEGLPVDDPNNHP